VGCPLPAGAALPPGGAKARHPTQEAGRLQVAGGPYGCLQRGPPSPLSKGHRGLTNPGVAPGRRNDPAWLGPPERDGTTTGGTSDATTAAFPAVLAGSESPPAPAGRQSPLIPRPARGKGGGGAAAADRRRCPGRLPTEPQATGRSGAVQRREGSRKGQRAAGVPACLTRKEKPAGS